MVGDKLTKLLAMVVNNRELIVAKLVHSDKIFHYSGFKRRTYIQSHTTCIECITFKYE